MSILPLASETIVVSPEDRYDRQRLIPWWDQDRLARARVLVVGAGALGNEILKLLALTGVGNTLIYDMDRIEHSNLSRTVLFRESDENAFKAEVAARRMQELNPGVKAFGLAHNVMHQAGLGIFLWADVVICGLDNRLARLFVNTSCARMGRAWIDGAIEGLSGVVRLFDPAHTACYECTMNEVDWRQIQERLSCAMLARDEVALGHAPTTAVAGSLIAALEVQEAIKYLHEQPTLEGEGIHIEGLSGDFSRIRYQRREQCQGHDSLGRVVPIECGVAHITLIELLDRAEARLGGDAVLELSRDVVTRLSCPSCGFAESVGVVLGFVRESDAACPRCQTHRVVEFVSTIQRDGDVDLSLTPADIGVPLFDVIVARRGLEAQESWLFDGDADQALGPLAATLSSTIFSA
ncbi:MAG TPA: ThiF family adenylyltransferase [Pyrinomonadaceae bacterium]|jgi:adenylyltransferase/sulfurtransferase|nr:ThiF family adenylyltransferase [Pyrinomonadaceae bacterium]